jgi:hypothetical protein
MRELALRLARTLAIAAALFFAIFSNAGTSAAVGATGSQGYDSLATATTAWTTTRIAALGWHDDSRNAPRARTGADGVLLAAKAGGAAGRTVTALTREQDAALSAVMRDPNRLEHIFGQAGKHNLAQLTQELGGQQAVVREAILRVPRGQAEGVFKIASQVGSHRITVTGRMMNGVPRISNIWVPR